MSPARTYTSWATPRVACGPTRWPLTGARRTSPASRHSVLRRAVTLTDMPCPVLRFVGAVEDIGRPASVRGIGRAGPHAEVCEGLVRTGPCRLVVASKAGLQSWPTVAEWVRWISKEGDKPG